METRTRFRIGIDYFYIVLGALVAAIAVTSIYDVRGIVIGGLSGLAIIIKELTRGIFDQLPEGIPLWVTTGVLNIPLFVFGGMVKGRQFLIRSLVATVAFTFFLGVLPPLTFLPEDMFFNIVIGGVLTGVGMGFVFSAGATTGGSDMLATILQRFLRQFSVPGIMAFVNGVVVVMGIFVFGIENLAYALVAIYIESFIADRILMGTGRAKLLFIVSDKSVEIAQSIMDELERGISGIDIRGMYTGKDKVMLLCVVADKELIKAKDIIYEQDANAFAFVSDVVEAIGEGSIHHVKQ